MERQIQPYTEIGHKYYLHTRALVSRCTRVHIFCVALPKYDARVLRPNTFNFDIRCT